VAGASTIDWRRAGDALADQVARVTTLLRSVGDPGAPAVGDWNLAQVAMHLSQAWLVVPGLAADNLSDIATELPGMEVTTGGSLINDLWELSDVTSTGVDGDSERDPAVLADRIDERARLFLAGLEAQLPEESHAWLVDGVRVSRLTLICHLLNETTVHGFDIARADGRKWVIPPSHAAMIVDGFLVPVIAGLGPRDLVDQEAAHGLRATYEIHVRGGGRHLFVFDDGTLVVESPGSRPVDCHISADPAAFLLVAWGRRSQWSAIARGQLVAWGRRPWLGPRFRHLIRNP